MWPLLAVFSLGLQSDVVTASLFCTLHYCQYVAHFWMSARRLVTTFLLSTAILCPFLGVFSLGLQADVVTASLFCASWYCQYVAHLWMSARRLVTAFLLSTSCYCHFVSLLGVFSLGLQADVVAASPFSASWYCQYVAHFWMSARRLVTTFDFSTSCYCHFVSLSWESSVWVFRQTL